MSFVMQTPCQHITLTQRYSLDSILVRAYSHSLYYLGRKLDGSFKAIPVNGYNDEYEYPNFIVDSLINGDNYAKHFQPIVIVYRKSPLQLA